MIVEPKRLRFSMGMPRNVAHEFTKLFSHTLYFIIPWLKSSGSVVTPFITESPNANIFFMVVSFFCCLMFEKRCKDTPVFYSAGENGTWDERKVPKC